MPENDWSDAENDLIVEDYFDMLTAELANQPYVKAQHRRALMTKLNQRSEGSIEFKHQNISAVMLGLGEPRIEGYKPASQFQLSLVDAVLRRKKSVADWIDAIASKKRSARSSFQQIDEPGMLWIGPPPTQSNEQPPVDPALMAAISYKFDVAARDDENRKLGNAGERLVFENEKQKLLLSGQPRLADQVRWASRELGDGLGYDIESFDEQGNRMLIEVKTTNGWERTPFHISRNEISVADSNRDIWHLYRVWNFVRHPKAFAIRPPLQAHVALTPTSFLASLL